MIKEIIVMLNNLDTRGISYEVEVASGLYKEPKTFKEFFVYVKRMLKNRKLIKNGR